ncbi:hypothetical protein OF83DRAFT_1136923 [Amylostereum chailletii]|nr:hypothetical protein OF83DRAFT_1136923 [Amylostereum chailletii]
MSVRRPRVERLAGTLSRLSNLSQPALPPEIWIKILHIAIYVENVEDIHPSSATFSSSPCAIVPDDFSIVDLRSSLRLRTSVARVSRWFRDLTSAAFPYRHLIVTNDNAHILRRMFLEHTYPRRMAGTGSGHAPRTKHPLSLSVRHLVVDIRTEMRSHRKRALGKALGTIARHLPNIITFTSACDASLTDTSYPAFFGRALCRALSLVPARTLRKIVFRDAGHALFPPLGLEKLLSTATRLQTLVFRAGACPHPYTIVLPASMPHLTYFCMDQPRTGIQLPFGSASCTLPCLRRLHVCISSGSPLRWAPLWPLWTRNGAGLTHLSFDVDPMFPPVQTLQCFTDDTGGGTAYPQLAHLSLTSSALSVSILLRDGIPPVHTLSVAIMKASLLGRAGYSADMSRTSVLMLISSLSSLVRDSEGLSKLRTVRIAEDEVVRVLQGMIGGEVVSNALERLWKLPFEVVDSNGRRLADALTQVEGRLDDYSPR